MKNKIIPIILIFIMSLSGSVFATDVSIVSWEDISVYFDKYLNEDIMTYSNVGTLQTAFNNSNKFWFFSNGVPSYLKGTSTTYYDKNDYDSTMFYVSFGSPTFTYSNNCFTISNLNAYQISLNTKTITKVTTLGSLYLPLDRHTNFSANDFRTQLTFEYLMDTITIASINFYLTPSDNTAYTTIQFDSINSSDYPWNNSDENGSDISYDYSNNDYYINRNKPYFSISNLNGFVTNVESKPSYILDEYYKGKYYFNLPFYIYNDPNSTYDFTHYTLRVGLYKPNISGDTGTSSYKILDYFDATPGAVYISGDTGTDLYNGYDKYLYDLFNLVNYNGQIDSYIDEYGKEGLAFQLFIYSPFNEQIANTPIITLNGNLTEHKFDNNIDNNLIFKENDDFLGLLESSKLFISHFLSFFDIFPDWLTTLIATAITVAIVCRLIGR